jgi:hypothetical protein
MVHEQLQRVTREMTVLPKDVVARAAMDAQAQAVEKAARAWAAQTEVEEEEAEEATWNAHWANALAEGQTRRAAEESSWVTCKREWRAATKAMTPGRMDASPTCGGVGSEDRLVAVALVLSAVESASASLTASRARDCE